MKELKNINLTALEKEIRSLRLYYLTGDRTCYGFPPYSFEKEFPLLHDIQNQILTAKGHKK